MKYSVMGAAAIGLVTILVNAPVRAHHEISAKFDPNKTITLKGFVTRVDWRNPHAHVFMNVQDGSGVATWAIELESPIDLLRSGWREDTVKFGDAITVEGIVARNGSRQAWARSMVLDSSGKRIFELNANARPRNTRPAGPTPRWPDGKPRLGPAPGETGYWANPTATSLIETGVNVEVNAHGLLRNIADVDKVAPFQRWARDLYELRQRNFLRDDPMFLNCMPPGGPRQFQIPYGVQFLEEYERQRIFVLLGGGNHNWRLIYLDGRPQRGSVRGDDDNPLYYGRAVAKWEGDTLVVDTRGFNEKFWFSNGGLPHTDQLHLIERISRPDSNTLRYEVTIDDPGAYTRTWKSAWNLQWIPGEELPAYFCQDNRP